MPFSKQPKRLIQAEYTGILVLLKGYLMELTLRKKRRGFIREGHPFTSEGIRDILFDIFSDSPVTAMSYCERLRLGQKNYVIKRLRETINHYRFILENLPKCADIQTEKKLALHISIRDIENVITAIETFFCSKRS